MMEVVKIWRCCRHGDIFIRPSDYVLDHCWKCGGVVMMVDCVRRPMGTILVVEEREV